MLCCLSARQAAASAYAKVLGCYAQPSGVCLQLLTYLLQEEEQLQQAWNVSCQHASLPDWSLTN